MDVFWRALVASGLVIDVSGPGKARYDIWEATGAKKAEPETAERGLVMATKTALTPKEYEARWKRELAKKRQRERREKKEREVPSAERTEGRGPKCANVPVAQR